LNQEQKKFLKERLSEIAKGHRDNGPKPPQEPAAVKAARRVVRAWDIHHNRYEHNRGRRVRIDKAANKVREIILFAEPAKALKAIAEFEQREFK
jgi:ATP-dependent DNA ligase